MLRRLRDKLQSGLAKTRRAMGDQLSQLGLSGRRVDDELIDELEEVLVGADLGIELSEALCDRLRRTAKGREVSGVSDLLRMVEQELLELVPAAAPEQPPEQPPRVTLVVGVNGSGKTTTTGKLAARWARQGREVVVAAADTFRAAAVEQLVVWAERAGARVVRARPGADPAAVAFDATRSGRSTGADEVLVDTAGRLHTKKPLMEELSKISRAVGKEVPGAPHETLLVVDGTTGRNGVAQAQQFAEVVPVSGLVLTKLDGTARGGVAVSIGRELGLPVRYIGVGETPEDLLDYDAEEFVAGLTRLDGADAG